MNKTSRILWGLTILTLAALACNMGKTMAATQTPEPTVVAPLPPTLPPPAAQAPLPTVEPALPVADTPAPPTAEILPMDEDPLLAQVREYYEQGYLPYPNGQLTELPDFSFSQPGADLHDLTRSGAEAQDFAVWADVELNTVGGETRYPNYTGCGFAFRAQSGTGYTAILTNDYVRMGACVGGMRKCDLFGTLYGDGKTDVRNKQPAAFSLAVNRNRAYVFVDGVLAGQYGLYTTRLLGTGDLYYDAVSNYGAGYWTTCKITNVKLWESLP